MVCSNIVFLYYFFAILLSGKHKDFFIIKTLFEILHVFVLLYKDKLKVQHESATCKLTYFQKPARICSTYEKVVHFKLIN